MTGNGQAGNDVANTGTFDSCQLIKRFSATLAAANGIVTNAGICINNMFLLPSRKSTDMGRYIGIGILYQVDFHGIIPKDKVIKKYSEELFDYTSFEKDRRIYLRNDIAMSELADLRKKLIDFCGLEEERRKDVSTEWREVCYETQVDSTIRRSTSLEQLAQLLDKELFYTFQKSEEMRVIFDESVKYYAACQYFMIYYSPYKFYSVAGYSAHGVTRKIERLIQLGLADNRLKNLVECFLTQ